MKPHNYRYHLLDDGLSYMSCHIGEGHILQVITTPIAKASEEEHRAVLEKKVKRITVDR